MKYYLVLFSGGIFHLCIVALPLPTPFSRVLSDKALRSFFLSLNLLSLGEIIQLIRMEVLESSSQLKTGNRGSPFNPHTFIDRIKK